MLEMSLRDISHLDKNKPSASIYLFTKCPNAKIFSASVIIVSLNFFLFMTMLACILMGFLRDPIKEYSINYLRIASCYLNPHHLFACNTQWKCIKGLIPPAYVRT